MSDVIDYILEEEVREVFENLDVMKADDESHAECFHRLCQCYAYYSRVLNKGTSKISMFPVKKANQENRRPNFQGFIYLEDRYIPIALWTLKSGKVHVGKVEWENGSQNNTSDEAKRDRQREVDRVGTKPSRQFDVDDKEETMDLDF